MKKKKNQVNEHCKIYTDTSIGIKYDCYLNNNIDEPHKYSELLEILRKATDKDTVSIHINNGGGKLNTGMQIVNTINICKAEVITIMEGPSHSCASIIFLAGNKKIVRNHSYMLCHYFSGGLYGKGQELEAQAKHEIKYIKEFFRIVYKNFMTTKELERLFKGEDFWFDSKEINKRIK